jgi:hypothetical protein
MFIPAHLTHKVITLQKYLGLGSFHAGLPGFIDLLLRWKQLPPLWASPSTGDDRCSVEFLTRRAIRKIHSLKKESRSERFRWGMPYLKARLQRPDVNDETNREHIVRDNDNLRAFISAAERLA